MSHTPNYDAMLIDLRAQRDVWKTEHQQHVEVGDGAALDKSNAHGTRLMQAIDQIEWFKRSAKSDLHLILGQNPGEYGYGWSLREALGNIAVGHGLIDVCKPDSYLSTRGTVFTQQGILADKKQLRAFVGQYDWVVVHRRSASMTSIFAPHEIVEIARMLDGQGFSYAQISPSGGILQPSPAHEFRLWLAAHRNQPQSSRHPALWDRHAVATDEDGQRHWLDFTQIDDVADWPAAEAEFAAISTDAELMAFKLQYLNTVERCPAYLV